MLFLTKCSLCKKEFIKEIVCFIKVAIEQDSVIPQFFNGSTYPGPAGEWHTVGALNRDQKDNSESDAETLREGGK
jgi:hypothetical protein